MKISCIVTVYNRMEYLKNIVKCLIMQTYQIDELIIADDGSSQKVVDYIREILPNCNFTIKHIYQKDIGFRLARSRNNGAKEAEGDLLVFIDQDVIFGKNYIKEIVEQAKRKRIIPLKVLWSTFEEKEKIQKKLNNEENYQEILEIMNCEQKKDRNKQIFKDKIRSIKFRLKLRKKVITIGGASFALFKEDYIKVNGFDEEFKGHGNEDLDFGYRLQKLGINPLIINISEAPIHMAHSKDPTAGSNTDKLQKIKEERKKEFYCKYGYTNSLDLDKYRIEILKGNE